MSTIASRTVGLLAVTVGLVAGYLYRAWVDLPDGADPRGHPAHPPLSSRSPRSHVNVSEWDIS
jgi:hypothetical protein